MLDNTWSISLEMKQKLEWSVPYVCLIISSFTVVLIFVFHFAYTCEAVPMKIWVCLACDECFDQLVTYFDLEYSFFFVRICKQGDQQVVFITLIQFFWYDFDDTCLLLIIDLCFQRLSHCVLILIWQKLVECFKVFSSLFPLRDSRISKRGEIQTSKFNIWLLCILKDDQKMKDFIPK